MKNKFNAYDVVKIMSQNPELVEINGKEGIVLGVPQIEEDYSIFTYSVYVLDPKGKMEECWSVDEEDLQPTGKKMKEEDIYTGETVRVRVDPETGEGYLVEDEDE